MSFPMLFPRLPPNLGSQWGALHAPVAGAARGSGPLGLAWHAAFGFLLVCFSLSQGLHQFTFASRNITRRPSLFIYCRSYSFTLSLAS